MNQHLCSKCIGAKEVMEPKKDKGFEYKTCSLCKGVGYVDQEINDDFELSLNEDQLEFEDFN